MSERPEAFQGVSSLPDDFDGTLDNCRFGKNPKYTIKETGAMPVVFSFDILAPELGENQDMILTIGNGFKAEENGTLAVLEKPRSSGKTGFQDNSNIMGWINRLFELDEAAMLERYESTQYPPQDARFWEGLRCHFNREKYKDFRGTERDKLMPTALLGWGEGDGEVKAKPATAKKKASKKKAAAKPKAEPADEGVDDETLAALDAIADECETYDEFVSRAFSEVDGADSEPLYSVIMAGEDTEGSVWVRALERAEE